jgi:pyruvate/2-oxoglutarate dehydrogenase complex dihydrolipoamide acyltransferase (E2) component
MKTLNQILFTVAVAGTISLATNASAQYRAVGDDGIAASPKVRQQLNERKAARAASVTSANNAAPTVASAGYRATRDDGITASPKVRQMLAEQKVAVTGTPSAEVASAGYRATGPDGITASPKLRQQLDQRNTTIMVAPVK